MEALPEPLIALDGRSLGRRGAQTRRRLLDATATRLESEGIRDLRVVDIARAVGTSPATFYQYFRDVEEAVLALATEVGDDIAPLAVVLTRSWTGPAGLDSARIVVEGFVEHWDAHHAVLRTRNLAAQEGDERFRDVRSRALLPFTDGFTRLIADARARGDVAAEITPAAAAVALVSMVERMAAFHTDLEPMGIRRADLVETTARIIAQTVGSTPPAG